MPHHIVLLTDFGLADPYVGQMKGVLFSHAPDALVMDLCHQVEPFNILQAGFFLAASRAYFPAGSIFAAVVDPGVGSTRRIVLLETRGQYFLAPDNGLLTLLLQDDEPATAWNVTPTTQGEASATFHGRDIFAPLAARLTNGVPSWRLGPEMPLTDLVRLPESEPVRTPEGVQARVLHVDHFGNCLLNLRCAAWTGPVFDAKSLTLTVPARLPLVPAAIYERLEMGSIGILAGSQGYLELTMNKRSVAAFLGFAPGDTVEILINSR